MIGPGLGLPACTTAPCTIDVDLATAFAAPGAIQINVLNNQRLVGQTFRAQCAGVLFVGPLGSVCLGAVAQATDLIIQ